MKGVTMFKKNWILFCLFALLFSLKVGSVNAASASITIKANNQVNIGSTFQVSVTVRSTDVLGSWEYHLGYDSDRLTLVSGDKDVVGYGDATKKTQTYTYKFKAKATGSAKIQIGSASVVDWITEKEISTTKGSKTVQIIKPSTSTPPVEEKKSHNSYLKSLIVDKGTLSPEFSKEQENYQLVLEKETTSLKIQGETEDKQARIAGDGEIEVKEGDNKIEIKVTAEDGDIRTYTINAYVEEANPLMITIDKKEYQIVKKASLLDIPDGFFEEEYTLKDQKIPTFISDNQKVRLVGLKDNDGNYTLAIIDNNEFLLYKPITIGNIDLLVLPFPKTEKINGYEKYTLELEEIKIESYRKNASSPYSLIYGINKENGKKNIYQYDEVEKTIQRYQKVGNYVSNTTILKSGVVFIAICLSFVFSVIYGAKKRVNN